LKIERHDTRTTTPEHYATSPNFGLLHFFPVGRREVFAGQPWEV